LTGKHEEGESDRKEHSQIADELTVATAGKRASGASRSHPSRSLGSRSKGYGIGGGIERPYRKDKSTKGDGRRGLYGPLPHSGYYGAGSASRPFKAGQATYSDELELFRNQYGERTSGFEEAK
jgi:hypothetical protein